MHPISSYLDDFDPGDNPEIMFEDLADVEAIRANSEKFNLGDSSLNGVRDCRGIRHKSSAAEDPDYSAHLPHGVSHDD
jgi:hypothetical protein